MKTMLELNHRTYGEPTNPTLVLLHGLFGSATNWGSIARGLADRYHVLVPDLRNHGQSPHHDEHSYDAMVADVLGLLDRYGVSQAGLVGHSMGGKVAMHLALNHPQRVRELAVVDIAPVSYSHDFQSVLDAFDAVELIGLKSRAEADAQMADKVVEPGVWAFLLQNLVKGLGGWEWRLNLNALDDAQADIVAFPTQIDGVRFDGPVIMIHGERSDYLLPQYRLEVERYFPSARFCQVGDAGHWVYAEQPQGFLDCLMPFLNGAVDNEKFS